VGVGGLEEVGGGLGRRLVEGGRREGEGGEEGGGWRVVEECG
jgi:hypothetical protein